MSWSGSNGQPCLYGAAWQSAARRPTGPGYRSLAELGVPRSRLEVSTLTATVFLALLMHATGLFAYIVLSPSVSRDNYTFFSEVQLVKPGQEISMTEIQKPKPPPPAPPPPAKVPEQPVVSNPAPAPPPAPARNPSKNPAPLAPVASRPVRNPESALPVVASAKGTGMTVVVGRGGGDPQGVPGGTGQGQVAGVPGGVPGGTPGGVPGGTGSGGVAMVSTERTTSISLYDSWAALGVSRPPCAVELGTWADVCRITGLPEKELMSRAKVPPFFTHAANPELRDQEQLNGRSGVVKVRVVVSTSGAPRPEIIGTSGDKLMDRIGMYIAQNSRWLPAMNYGRPVEDTVEYDISFTSAR